MAPVTATVRVESIAAGGDGVARAEGFVVFVPRSAPGDVGTVDVAMRGSFARAPFVRLLEPSPSRIDPPCPHYTEDRCGGCQLQHMEYGAQLEAKAGIIRDSIQRIGKREHREAGGEWEPGRVALPPQAHAGHEPPWRPLDRRVAPVRRPAPRVRAS